MQAALEKKQQECDELKSLVEELRIEKALQQQESAVRLLYIHPLQSHDVSFVL